MTPLRVLVVDDEAPARAKLMRYLEADERVEVVGEAANGVEAVERIVSLRPDVALLDVQMPGLDGFDVLASLEEDEVPHVVFVTAHDEHAVRAFEVRALDYLLKPVDRERLRSAMGRVIETGRSPADALAVLEVRPPPPGRSLDRFLVRERGRLRLVPAADVDWIGAAGNYVELHVGSTTHLVRGTLTELEERLPGRFARVHRSTIVNLDRVKELQPWSHGDLVLVLADGSELRMSRRYRDRIPGVFGG